MYCNNIHKQPKKKKRKKAENVPRNVFLPPSPCEITHYMSLRNLLVEDEVAAGGVGGAARVLWFRLPF